MKKKKQEKLSDYIKEKAQISKSSNKLPYLEVSSNGSKFKI